MRAKNLKDLTRNNKYLLKASYENAMALEKYTDDTKIDDDYEKAVVESAKKHLDNTTKSRKFVNAVRKLAKDRKTRYIFTNNQELWEQGDLVVNKKITAEEQAQIKSLENQLSEATTKEERANIQAQIIALKYLDSGGMVRINENGVETVLINVDSMQSMYSVVGHETKHLLEKYELNKDFNKVLFAYANAKGDLDTIKNRIEAVYEGIENVEIDGEIAAELTGKYLFEDEKFLETLMKNKSDSKVQQVIDKIKELIDDLVIRFKGTEQEKQLREVQKKFTELYNSNEADIVNEVTEGIQYALTKNGKSIAKKVKTNYNEVNTLAMQWANNPGTQQGEVKGIYDGNGNAWAFAVADKDAVGGYRLYRSGSYMMVEAYERIYGKTNDGFNRYVETYQSNKRRYPGSLWESRIGESSRPNSGYVDEKQRTAERDFGATNDEYVWSNNYEIPGLSDITLVEAEKLHTNFVKLLEDSKLITKSQDHKKNIEGIYADILKKTSGDFYYERTTETKESISKVLNKLINTYGGVNSAELRQMADVLSTVFAKDYKFTNETKAGSTESASFIGENTKQSIAKQGENVDYNKSLRSIKYNPTDDILPVREDIAKKPTTVYPDDIAPIREDEANALLEEQNNVLLTDEDVPPESDAPMYDVADSTKINDTTLKGIGQRLRETLSLTARETKAIQEVVQKYSTTEIPNNEQLFKEIKEKFGEKNWTERNEEIADIKKIIKGFQIKVSDTIKSDITDYGDWKKSQFGKLRFSKDGLPVDDIYMGLSVSYPQFFPADIVNPTDQLLAMAEVMNLDTNVTETFELDDDTIQQATDIVISEVNKYKENELTQHLAEEQSHFYKEVIANDDLAGKRAQLNEWYENRKAELHKELDDRNAFVSNRAKGFYNELNNLKKGVRASQELGYFLDFGFNWSELKSTLLQVSKWPDEVIRPGSNVESIVREAIGREYEDRLYDLDDLDTEYQKKLKALENPVKSPIQTVKERLNAKLENVRKELLMNQQLRDDSLADFEKEISRLQAEYNAKRDKNTKVANNILRRIERLQRMKNDVAADYSKKISDIEKRIEKLESKDYATVEQRKTKQQEYSTQMEQLIGDTSTWVDKKMGISYKVNTLKRNLRDIVRDANGKKDIAKADAIYDELQGKYNHNEAELNREANRIKQQFAEMKITKAEDTYIQMLGELRHNPETTLTEEVVKDFYNKHKNNIDKAKVDKVIEMARPLYDDLLSRVNQVLSEQGMKEIPYRKGYFPHFTEEKQGILGKLFNWKTKNNDIPTDIAGLTETFTPNRSWQSFNKQRKSDTTDYSFLKGLDTYVQGSLDWIYHIEDIQKRRAFENHIRYVHSEQGIQDKIDAIRNNEEYDANEVQDQIDLVYKEAGNPLNNFVTDFKSQTNTLSGKKSSLDRGMEEMTNRKFYSTMTNISNRVSANMVGGSVSSALTNFIPITQSWGEVSPISSLRAMGETIRSTFRDDGTINKSDFLTNRLKKSENLYKTTWDKIGDKAAFLMEGIDNFTSQTVWRSKYLENISKGMSESEAIKNADEFAEGVLAGRSRGNNPTIFDSKKPLIKTLTVFQLEVNNQYGYMFKDMPQDLANESKAKLVKGYITMFLGAYAYNALYSSLVGRDAAFDPIGIIEDLLRDLGVLGDDDEEEEIAPVDVALNLTDNLLEEVPFVGGLLGGGRIPISSALPYGGITEAFEGTLQDLSEGNTASITKEWLNPLLYIAMPTGGGQIKKSWQGLKMFDDKLPVAGSYTDSGNLRFPVEDTFGNRVQAAVFGQYANKNARAYFDNDILPLKEKQIKEYADVELPIADYWKVREDLKDFSKQDEKVDYINGLDITEKQKNVLKSYLYDEEGYKEENPEKYAFLESEGIGFLGYKELDDETQESWSWAFKHQDEYRHLKANGVYPEDYSVYRVPMLDFDDEDDKAYDWSFNNPEKATLGKVFGNGVKEYRQYTSELYEIKSDKDSKGNSISGSRKQKVLDYINNLDIDYGAKCILLKSEYKTEDNYNTAIVDYLNSRDDISREEMITILEELGATIDENGYVYWN